MVGVMRLVVEVQRSQSELVKMGQCHIPLETLESLCIT